MKNMRSNKVAALLLSTLVSLLIAAPGFTQGNDQAEVQLQAAEHEQRVEGNLEQAIQMYKKILTEYAGNRPVAAKALLEMGECYEKLGQGEAQKDYQRVLRDYADQSAEANEARARLGALSGGAKSNQMVMRRVWAGPDVDPEGSPTPDGKYLPFVDWSTGDLALRDLITGEERRLTHKGTWEEHGDEFAEISVPSPDGKQVAYAWFKGTMYELRVIGIDGSHPRTIYRKESVYYIEPKAWTPDGKQILAAFVAKAHNSTQIVMVSVADGSVRVLKNLGLSTALGHSLLSPMCISPDGRYVAYSPPQKGNEDRHDIFLLPTDGSEEFPIVTNPADDYFLGWAPDGRTMLFASDRTGALSAWAIEVVNGKPRGTPRLLKPDIGGIQPLGFTQNGSFYYDLSDTVRDLYTASLDLDTGKLLAPPAPVSQLSTGSNFAGAWSPDGTYLAYLSTRHRPRRGPGVRKPDTIVIRSLATGEEREVVPKLDALFPFPGLRWSPDSLSLLVRGTDEEGREGVFRINAQTAESSMLLEPASVGGGEGIFFRMTRDGRSLIYGKRSPQGVQFVIRDLGSGQVRVVFVSQAMPSGLALSPDGSQITFDTQAYHTELPALEVVAIAGGEPRTLYTLKTPADFAWDTLAWSHDGTHIVFGVVPAGLRPNGQKTELWEIPAEGGQPHNLGITGDTVRLLRIHPDGKRLVYVSGQFSDEVGVMENFLPALRAAK